MNTAKKTLLFLFGTGLQQTTTFLLVAFLSRILNESDYATFKQGDLIVRTLLPLLVLGIPLSLSYFLPRIDDCKQKQFIYQSLFFLIFFGTLGMLVLVLLKEFISVKFLNTNLISIIPLYSIFLFFEVSTSFLPNYYLGTSQNSTLVIFASTFAVLRLIGVMIFYYQYQTIFMIINALVFTSGIKFIYMLFVITSRFRHEALSFEYLDFKAQLLYALPIGISQLVGVFSDMLDKIIVSLMFKPEDYAVFINGTIDIPFVGLISGSIAAVLLPKFARDIGNSQNTDRIIMNQWKESICYAALIIIPVMFCLLLYAEGFIKILFSAKYLASVDIFRIYILKMPVGIATFSTVLLAAKKNKNILFNSIACIFINLFFNLLLIPRLGLNGAAISTVLSMYLLAILQIYQISKAMKISIWSVMPYRRLILCLSISAITSYVFYTLAQKVLLSDLMEFFILGSSFIFLNMLLYHIFKIVDLTILLRVISKQNKVELVEK